MEFVQKFTPPDFQAKNFTPSISPNFNSFSGKKHKKWVKMEKFTPLAKILHCRWRWRDGQIPPLPRQFVSECSPTFSYHSSKLLSFFHFGEFLHFLGWRFDETWLFKFPSLFQLLYSALFLDHMQAKYSRPSTILWLKVKSFSTVMSTFAQS